MSVNLLKVITVIILSGGLTSSSFAQLVREATITKGGIPVELGGGLKFVAVRIGQAMNSDTIDIHDSSNRLYKRIVLQKIPPYLEYRYEYTDHGFFEPFRTRPLPIFDSLYNLDSKIEVSVRAIKSRLPFDEDFLIFDEDAVLIQTIDTIGSQITFLNTSKGIKLYTSVPSVKEGHLYSLPGRLPLNLSKEIAINGAHLAILPNFGSSGDTYLIDASLINDDPYSLKIVDITGQEIYRINDIKGDYRGQLSPSNFSSGEYFLSIESKGQILNVKSFVIY